MGALRRCTESKLGEQQRTLKSRCLTGNEEGRIKQEGALICKRLWPFEELPTVWCPGRAGCEGGRGRAEARGVKVMEDLLLDF